MTTTKRSASRMQDRKVRFWDEDWEQLQKLAEERGMKTSELVRKITLNHLTLFGLQSSPNNVSSASKAKTRSGFAAESAKQKEEHGAPSA